MAADLSLPVPVLIINQHQTLPDVLLKQILIDLGYPAELIHISLNLMDAKRLIEQHLPNLIFCGASTAADTAFIHNIQHLHPSAYLISVHSSQQNKELITALQAGANAYILRDAAPTAMFDQIKVILRGGATLHPSFAQFLINTRFKHTDEALSPAEYQILRHIGQEASLQQTASVLKISEYQVDSLIKNILRKLI